MIFLKVSDVPVSSMEEWLSETKSQHRIINPTSPNQNFYYAILVTFIALYTVFFAYKGKRDDRINLPPSPPKLPILGHLHLLGCLPHRVLAKLSTKYGPVMLLRLGRCQAIVVSSVDAAKAVLKTYDKECANRPLWQGIRALSYDRLDVAFSPYGDYSRGVKKLFSLELLAKRAQMLATVRETEVNHLMDSIAMSDSTPIMLDDLFYKLTDRIIGTAAFGRTYGADYFKDHHKFRDVFATVTKVHSSISAEDFFPSAAIGRVIDKLNRVAALRKRTFQELDAFFELIVDKHSDPTWQAEQGHEDLVDGLLKKIGEQLVSVTLTREHIKAILFDTFIGGVDTPAVMLQWAFTEIIKNQRVMERLVDEIRNALGKTNKAQLVRAEDIERIPYLKMVVKETMRLHPVVPLLVPRVTTAPINIGTYHVPSDTVIYVNVWAIGRDPSIWENPEEFCPERFEGTDVEYFRGSDFQFIPFGAGRRMCPGFPMGIATVELALANLLYRFNWELPRGMTVNNVSMEESGGITFSRKTCLELVPKIYNPQT